MNTKRLLRWGEWYLRIALGTTFLVEVADRFGFLGPHGSKYAGWGDWQHFLAYCAQVNSFLPAALIPFAAWAATLGELIFGLALITGFRLREAAFGSAALLTLFGLAMAISFGIKSPLDYSVFSNAGGSLLLGAMVAARCSAPESHAGAS